MFPGFTGPVQIAYAVADIREAADAWQRRGIGPFHFREHIGVANSRVRGEAAPFDHSSAFAQWGDVMVELICEHVASPLPAIGPAAAVHHVAFFVDDFAAASAALTTAGFVEVLYAEAGSTPFAFHDATSEFGHLIEIYEATAPLTAFYDLVRGRPLTH